MGQKEQEVHSLETVRLDESGDSQEEGKEGHGGLELGREQMAGTISHG
jgi:hypothetical protein